MKPTVMKPTAMKPAAMKQSALKPTESSQVSLRTENVSADSRGWKKEEKMHDPFGDIRASPYIKKTGKTGEQPEHPDTGRTCTSLIRISAGSPE
ncbi:hypothetical protein [[Ruminococcus] torques]|uniref:hypothetical protein n=1 Tax=[Ruminococcus] torques TaxID=33039 RepID=UPI003521E565